MAPTENAVIQGYGDRPDLAGRRRFLSEHVFLHTHIPKTAGSTLAAGLSAIVGGVDSLDLRLRRRVELEDLTREDLASLRLLSGHFEYGVHSHFDRRPLYVAAVRDPVERAVSYYRFLLESPDHNDHGHVAGRDFETAWAALDSHHRGQHRNLQSRYLTGHRRAASVDEALLWNRVEAGYFLLVPQDRVGPALQSLRAAFGLPHTRIPKLNVSRSPDVDVSDAIARRIRDADALDCALVERVSRNFPDMLSRACNIVAQACLTPL